MAGLFVDCDDVVGFFLILTHGVIIIAVVRLYYILLDSLVILPSYFANLVKALVKWPLILIPVLFKAYSYPMPTVERSALVPFSAEQMYQLINDVGRYPEFIANCSDSQVIEQGEHHMKASLTVKKGIIRETFATVNRLTKNQKIEMELLDGPFKSLHGVWLLSPLSDAACKIEFHLSFEFSSGLLGKAFAPIFSQLANDMVMSFQQRAQSVYK